MALNNTVKECQDLATKAVSYQASLFPNQDKVIAAIKEGIYEKVGEFRVGQQVYIPKNIEGIVIIDKAKIEKNYTKGIDYVLYAPKKWEGPKC